MVASRISDQADQRLATGVLVAEPERPDIENAPEMGNDSFEEDSVVYTTKLDSDNEDAVSRDPFMQGVFPHPYFQELEVRLAKWFRSNDVKWVDLMYQIQSSEPGGPSPKPSKVAREEVVEKYDDDFDVKCDLPSIKVRATPNLIGYLKALYPLALSQW